MNLQNLDLSKFIPTAEKVTVENYPYGFKLRTTQFDSMDFDFKKGYRTVTQTICPKSGRLNKPKKSTYSEFIFRYYNEENHIKGLHCGFNGQEARERSLPILFQLFPLLTPNEVDYLYTHILGMLFIDMKATVIYSGAKLEDIKGYYEPIFNILKEALKNPTVNIFDQLNIDKEAIKSKCPENYQPFKIKSYGI